MRSGTLAPRRSSAIRRTPTIRRARSNRSRRVNGSTCSIFIVRQKSTSWSPRDGPCCAVAAM
jgi:hypothetical protein